VLTLYKASSLGREANIYCIKEIGAGCRVRGVPGAARCLMEECGSNVGRPFQGRGGEPLTPD